VNGTQRPRVSVLPVLTLFSLLALAEACSGQAGPGSSASAPVASVRVSLALHDLTVGQTTQATAILLDASGKELTGRTIRWSSNNAAVATVGATGAVQAVAVGAAQITATSEGVSGSASLGVTVPSTDPVATVSVSLGSSTLAVGQVTLASAVLRDAAGSVLGGLTVTWSSSNAAVASVTASGVVRGVGLGNATISAAVQGRIGTAPVGVVPPTTDPVATVSVSLGSSTLAVGQTTQASAVLRDAAGSVLGGRTVSWSSDSAAAVVDGMGVVSAVGVGQANIIAASEGKTGSAPLTVSVPSSAPVASVAVTLTPSSVTVGQTSQASAVLRDASGNVLTGRQVTWSSDSSAASVDANGVVQALAIGSANITGTSEGKTGSAALTVTAPSPAPVASVAVTLTPSSVTVGQTSQASAVLRDASGNVLTGRQVTWSSDSSAASVDANGVVQALAVGSANITGTSEGVSGSAGLAIAARSLFPLAISPSRNGLLDASGNPFIMQGDAAWSAIAELSQSDAVAYLDDRQSRGFNTILVNLVEHSFTSHSPNWANAEGNVPFTGRVPGTCPSTGGTSYCNDMSTPNDAYFQHADWFLQQALSRNILVLLAPAYLGFAGMTDGWFKDMNATGTSGLTAYGTYLGNRYKGFPNILWVEGGDYTPPDPSVVTAIVDGIKDGGATQLHTAHWGGSPSCCQGPGSCYGPSPHPSWLDVDTVYVTNPPNNYAYTLECWQWDNGIRPVFFIEGPYENEYTPPTSPFQLRSDMYQPLLSGEVGFVFGVDPVWNFWDGGAGNKNEYGNDGLFPNWQAALPSDGGANATRAGQLMASLGSPSLVPDVSNTFVTAGAQSGTLAAATADGRLGLVYFINGGTIAVNMSKMAGTTTARWFDPSNGTYTTVAGSPFANTGSRQFTPIPTADGEPDILLVLQVQ